MQKDNSIETLRGLAILLVVTGHVIWGMNFPTESLPKYLFYTLIEHIQMPLFAAVAGFIYVLHPLNSSTWASWLSRKTQRILIPWLLVSTLYFLIQCWAPGTNLKGNLHDILSIYYLPYSLFWYLPALFGVFCLIVIFEKIKLLKTQQNWWKVLLFCLLILWLRDIIIPSQFPDYLNFKGVIYLLPFFILGMGISRYPENVLYYKYSNAIAISLSMCGLIVGQLIWFNLVEEKVNLHLNQNIRIWSLSYIIGTIILLFKYRGKLINNSLIFLGMASYSIYLFHGFGLSGARIILKQLGVQNISLLFIASLTFGLIGPIILDWLLKPFPRISKIWLGK